MAWIDAKTIPINLHKLYWYTLDQRNREAWLGQMILHNGVLTNIVKQPIYQYLEDPESEVVETGTIGKILIRLNELEYRVKKLEEPRFEDLNFK